MAYVGAKRTTTTAPAAADQEARNMCVFVRPAVPLSGKITQNLSGLST